MFGLTINDTAAAASDERPDSELQKPMFQFNSYISTQYDVKVFASKSSNMMRSSLGRFCNVLANAMNDHDKLPKYIIVVVEDDILRCVNFVKPGVSEVYGRDLQWLANEYHEIIAARKENLPKKARRFHYPQIFWMALTQHHNIPNNMLRHKFNQCLGTVVSLHKEMKMLRIRRHWSYNDFGVALNGNIVEAGKIRYWSGVDEAIEFWETGKKQHSDVHGGARNFVNKVHADHCAAKSAPKRRSQDRYFWERKKQKKLLRPPSEV